MSEIELRNIEELDLWNAFLRGDDRCLETLYRRYFDELYNYGNKWQNNASLTEDCIQDLFIKLLRTRKNLSTPVSVKYYLFRSFRSVIVDKLKTKNRIRFVDQPGEHLFIFDLCPEKKLVEQEEDRSLRLKLTSALNNLTPRQREAVFLRYIEGFSYKEVAEMMELTSKGTYKLMARAVEALKEQMLLVVLLLQKIFFLLCS